MAESGRTPTPRTPRHGYSRPPLSAARRTRDSFGQARLASLCDPAAPAPPRAALHLAHSSDRPRSHPDHAAARHARGSQGLCAASWWLDRRPSRPFAEGCAVSGRHSRTVARCAAPDVHRAGERGTVWTETRDSGDKILCVAGDADHMDRRVHDFSSAKRARICTRHRSPMRRISVCGSGGCRSATSRAAGDRARRPAHCRIPGD